MPRLTKWTTCGLLGFAVSALLFTSLAESQQGGEKKGKGGAKGKWARFEPGQVVPSSVLDELQLTPEQKKELDAINADLKAKLDKLLRNDQKQTIDAYRPGRGEEKGEDRPKKGPDQPDRRGDKGRDSEDRLGVRARKPNEDVIIQNGLTEGTGLVLQKVRDGSPAARAGLKTHDILLKFAGVEISTNSEEFRKVLRDIKPAMAVDAVVLRDGKMMTIRGIILGRSE